MRGEWTKLFREGVGRNRGVVPDMIVEVVVARRICTELGIIAERAYLERCTLE